MKLLNYNNLPVKSYYHQWITATGVTILMIELGLIGGWSSPYLARLTSPNSPLPLTSEEASWVASLYSPGRFIGAIIGSTFASYLGSKRTLLISVLPVCGCWIFTMFASTPIWLYSGRCLGGLGAGMALSCLSLYVGEIALPEIRGAIMSAAVTGGCTIGVVVSNICGSYLSMSISAAIYLVPCILVMILFFWLPESPHWLVNIKDYKGARRSIIWYQSTVDPNIELCVIRKLVASSNSQNFYEKIQKCVKSGSIRRNIIFIIVLFMLLELVGLYSIGSYMETILTRSRLTLMKPFVLVICVNASGIFGTIASMYTIDKYNRRFLFIVSCIGVVISQLCLGVNSYLIEAKADIPNLQWLPIVSIFMFINFYFIGLLSIPLTLLGEIFPSDVKSIVACVASLTCSTWLFVNVKSFQPLIDLIGEDCVFWIQSAFALLLIPHAYFFMPETKAKSLQQIQDEIMVQ